jgi:hypothetical protein
LTRHAGLGPGIHAFRWSSIFFGAHQIATIDLTHKQSVGDVSEQVSAMSQD